MSIESSFLRPKFVSNFSHLGKRTDQEDYLLTDREKGIFVIADGFGGASVGSEAAKIACGEIKNYLFKTARDLDATMPFVLRSYFSLAGNVLFNSMIYANKKLRKINHNKNIYMRGGASVLACFLDSHILSIASVGTCALWAFRKGRAVPLVLPKSYGRFKSPFEESDLNFSTPCNHALAIPLMALGVSEDLEPEIVEYCLAENDWLFLKTDGVSDRFSSQVAEIQKKNLSLEDSVRAVMALLNEGQYEDNAMVSLIFF